MEKPAETSHPISTLLKRRWSPRAIDPSRSVEREKIFSLLEAARWAPSAYNEQPWHYLVFDASEAKTMDQARSCLVEGNAWAKAAPVLLISVAKETFTHNGSANAWSKHDLGLASENLVLQAVEMGLVAHQMAGFDPQKARELFSIPEGFTPVAMIAVGYPGDLKNLNPKQQEMEQAPRARKEIGEFAFGGSWGKKV
jgi:nitroreductase